jgi:hypothetical protein
MALTYHCCSKLRPSAFSVLPLFALGIGGKITDIKGANSTLLEKPFSSLALVLMAFGQYSFLAGRGL